MKRLLPLLMCVTFNLSGMHIAQNTQLCLNNVPHNFGTTHFIVGYNEKTAPKKESKKQQSVFRKKQDSLLDGAPLIDKNRISQSFFTTIHDLSPIVLEVISQPIKRLYIAAFTLTDSRIVDSIIDAYKKGVDVCVITDASNMKQAYSKIQQLVDQNIPVWCYKPALNPNYKKNGLSEPFMHHKLIVGDDFVITGSANLTKAGQKTNMENITVLRDKKTIEEHFAEFKRLIKFCVKCTPEIRA